MLTEESRALVAALPFADIDVLVIEEGGKDISGTTLDPNVTGRFWVTGLADLDSPRVAMIVLLGLTAITAGNATGIGFVDFVPVALAEQVDWEQTYVNSFTAGGAGVRRGRMPMVLPDEDRASAPRCRPAARRSTRRRRSSGSTRRCTSRTAGSATRCSAELPGGARIVDP